MAGKYRSITVGGRDCTGTIWPCQRRPGDRGIAAGRRCRTSAHPPLSCCDDCADVTPQYAPCVKPIVAPPCLAGARWSPRDMARSACSPGIKGKLSRLTRFGTLNVLEQDWPAGSLISCQGREHRPLHRHPRPLVTGCTARPAPGSGRRADPTPLCRPGGRCPGGRRCGRPRGAPAGRPRCGR
jgi:hypothetical protein